MNESVSAGLPASWLGLQTTALGPNPAAWICKESFIKAHQRPLAHSILFRLWLFLW